MTQLIRTAASLIVNRGLPIHVRTIFSSSGIGLDNFKLAREQHVSRHASSIDAFKKRFLESINQPDSQVFTEDLRNMIMTAESDEEINGVIQALKKYNSNKLKFTDYHFGSPIMRLLYISNKPELGMELFMDENLKDIFQDSSAALILLNKLIEDKRYDDVIKIFEFGSQRGFATTSGRTYPTDVVMLTIEALYRQNTKQSLVKAKELISKVMERDSDVNPRTAAMLALLAIEQGEPSFAMEILGAVRAQNLTTIQNIRAICYAAMDRVEEAINVVHLLADQPPIDNDRRRVFPLVLEHIGKAVEKSKNPDLQSRFEDLSKFVQTNNRLSTTDLSDFLNEPISRRGAVLPNRLGVQQGPSSGFRNSGGNFRDGRFSNNRYERRPFSENPRSASSFNQENSIQQSTFRANRRENAPPPPIRSRDRDNEQNASRRAGTKAGPMTTTSTSPIPQRATRTNEDREAPPTQNRTSDKSSSPAKQEERQTGGNTATQAQSPWDRPVAQSS